MESWCNTPEDLASLKKLYIIENGEYVAKKVKKASVFKQFVLAELDGITDMDTAMMMKNKTVYAKRSDFKLDDGEFFIADLVGVDVIDAQTEEVYGKLKEIINRGASDIYVIETKNGERMIPAVDEFIVKIDINEGVFVKVIPGLLD